MNIWTRIDTDLGDALTWLKTFLTQTVESEVTALAPLAEAAVAAIVQDSAALTTPAGWIAAVAGVSLQLLPQIEAKAMQVAGASVLTAVGGALANAQAKAGTVAPVAAAPVAAAS